MESNSLHAALHTRIKAVHYTLIGFLAIFVARLCYLQIGTTNLLRSLGEKNIIRLTVIPPLRGSVIDCNSMPLATNEPVFDLYWQGSGMKRLSSSHEKHIEQINAITGLSKATLITNARYAEKYAVKTLLKKEVSFQELCMLYEQCYDLSSLVIEQRFARVYPHKNLACHILGYLSQRDQIGLNGLEKHLETVLSGKHGHTLFMTNAVGKKLQKKEQQDPLHGTDIKLTLDIHMQHLAQNLFSGDMSGALVIMDPEDGSIKSLVSYPSFDSNLFLKPISEQQWHDTLGENNALLNRVTSAVYPPASIFKLITIAAGLEENIIEPESVFSCKGYVQYGNRRYLCQRHWGHGELTTQEGLAVSCNVLCFEIAKHLTIDTLADYALRLGLGTKTNFLLPEKVGLVPTSAWKMEAKGERWWKGDTLSASIGQSYLQVTPLQIARMTGAICTGYLVKPRILDQETIEQQPVALSEQTLTCLRNAMKQGAQRGTGRKLRHLTNFKLFTKTGTAQTCGLTTKKILRTHYEHAWLTCFFQHAHDAKPLVMVVLIEHAGTTKPAVEIAKKFLEGYDAMHRDTTHQKEPL